MYKIAICDDSRECLLSLFEMTKGILQEEDILHDVVTYTDGKKLISDIRHGKKYSLLLLDVMMGSINGIELASVLRDLNDNTAIVFVSFNRGMAIYGYEVSATRFIEKPVKKEKLKEAVLHCYRLFQKERRILLPTKKGDCGFLMSHIIYAEAWDRGTRIVSKQGIEDTTIKISDLEELFSKEQFVMIHRAYMVNLAYVKYVRANEVELQTGELLPVSRLRMNEVKQKFVAYLEL